MSHNENIYAEISELFNTEISDPILNSVFTETRAYGKISGALPLLIVAPKGSWKTIIFKHIASNNSTVFYKSLTWCSRLEELNKLDETERRTVAKAILALSILEILMDRGIEKDIITRILERSGITKEQWLIDGLKRLAQSTKAVSVNMDGISLERMNEWESICLTELSSLLEAFSANSDIAAIKKILESQKSTILLDDFDKIDEAGGSPYLLAAILDVARSCNSVKFCFSLRKDTWLRLIGGHLDEADKYNPTEILWNNQELKNTIYNRLTVLAEKWYLIDLPESLSDWNDFFDYENKSGKKTLENYMNDASRKRPRDIIKLFSNILDASILENKTIKLPIGADVLKASSAKLWEEVYTALNSEDFFSLDKETTRSIFTRLASLFSGEKRQMSYQDFIRIANPILTEFNISADDFTQALFRYGVIGFSYQGYELFDNDADSKITLSQIEIPKSEISFAFIFRDVLRLKNLTGR